jgi:choline dehydrogenase-like flavoprotein
MRIDLEDEQAQASFESTVCIVGGGIAGLLLARNLAGRGIGVHLLEAGGTTLEARSQELYGVHMEGRHHEGASEGRFRVFGGSSTRWGGQLLDYTPDVFSPPAGTPSAPWPITTVDLGPYYPELRGIMHVSDPLPSVELLKPPAGDGTPDPADINIRFSTWAPFSKRNLAKTIGSECLRSGRITVFLHANATSIEVSKERGRVERIMVRNYRNKQYQFKAEQFVICAGTIECCRLLLASRTAFDCGIGNSTDQVGRYFHDHISVAAATVTENAKPAFVRSLSPLLVKGVLHTPKLEASSRLRQKQQLLAVMAHFAIEEPVGSGVAAVRELLQSVQHGRLLGKLPRAICQLPRNAGEIAKVVWFAGIHKRRAISSRATITLRIDSEQLPSAQNRIQLSTQRDTVGLFQAVINWHVSQEERRTVQTYAKVVDGFLSRLGVGPVAWCPELWESDDSWLKFTRDTYHPMGGTRMGTNPRDSVVDPNLQVHGISNLFVASCSTFPGGGSSNPTFTLMALALRLGAHLEKQCDARRASSRQEMCSLTTREPQLARA